MKNKRYDVITVGGLTADISFFAEEGRVIDNKQDLLCQKLLAFEAGAKVPISGFSEFFGGGAANTAVNLAYSGLKCACLATVGSDSYGRMILENLKDKKVSLEMVEKKTSKQSGVSFIVIGPGGERTIFSYRGANDSLSVSPANQKALALSEWLYITPLSHNWKSVLPKVFVTPGVRIAWNPGLSQCQAGAEALSRYLRRTDLFALNRDEALELLVNTKKYKDQPRNFWSSTDNILKAIFNFGPRIVLLTDGPSGAYAYEGDKVHFQPSLREKKRVDATGMGDRFNSSVLAGLIITGGDLKESLRMAARSAAEKIAHLGAQSGLIDLRKITKKK